MLVRHYSSKKRAYKKPDHHGGWNNALLKIRNVSFRVDFIKDYSHAYL